jgi:uncharacterized membrane protein
MKKLEDIIRDNREQFDDREPAKGHFERFQSKLERYNNKQTSFLTSWSFILKAAVVGVLVVLSGLWVYDNVYKSQPANQLSMKNVPSEFQETQIYYTSMVKAKYNEIQDFNFTDKKQKKMLLKELRTMDSIYYNIKQDFREHPNDPRVLHALIRHYQMKLDVMNQILDQLNQIQAIREQKNNNNKNNESHETTEL